MPMSTDKMIAEKVRRRLAPMIVAQRIKEPAVTRSEAFAGSTPSYVVTVSPRAVGPTNGTELRTDVVKALADLGPGVVVSIEAV